jgi:hypothetical protein
MGSTVTAEDALRMTVSLQERKEELRMAINEGAGKFMELAKRKAKEKHHDDHITESDLAQSVIHVKSHIFEMVLQILGDAAGKVFPPLKGVLQSMADAHEILHEWKGQREVEELLAVDHRETEDEKVHKQEMLDTAVKIDQAVEDRMKTFVDNNLAVSDVVIAGGSLIEVKMQMIFRLEECFAQAANSVKNAVRTVHALQGTEGDNVKKAELMHLLGMVEKNSKAVLDTIRKQVKEAQREIDIIKVANSARSSVWDSWMDEVIMSFVSHYPSEYGAMESPLVNALVTLNDLQTMLFATKKGDIFDQHVQSAEDIVHFHGVDRITDEQHKSDHDPLLVARMKLRGERAPEGEDDDDDDDDHGHGSHGAVALHRQNQLILFLMFGLLVLYGWVANLIGSHLLGAFIAGMSFCWMDAALILWQSQVKRIANWLIRLFFGATVAFSIPIDSMMDAEAVWKGALLGVGPCCLTKILAGSFTGIDKWVVGFAMVGRGEFAYLVAQTAQDKLLNPAPSGFGSPNLRLMSDGYYCMDMDLDGTCDLPYAETFNPACLNITAAADGRRQLSAAPAGGAEEKEELWCKHFSDGTDDGPGDGLPLRGEHYWQVGDGCNEHVVDCDCEMMMPAKAFSICVWALVMASLLAPIGFGMVLTARKRVGEAIGCGVLLLQPRLHPLEISRPVDYNHTMLWRSDPPPMSRSARSSSKRRRQRQRTPICRPGARTAWRRPRRASRSRSQIPDPPGHQLSS